jgi:murein DD-endopeptidase MepM/ murein hydrolase activator NlpD
MTRNSDPLFNLADALSEDIVAVPADTLVHDAESNPGGRAGLVGSFDRIAGRAAAQSRRRRFVERLRTLLHAWPVPLGWTSAMAGVAGMLVMGIVGGMYFHQAQSYREIAAVPPRVLAERGPGKTDVPIADGGPMSYAASRAARVDPDAQSNRAARSDQAAAVQQTPAAAPAAPPPAPTAAPSVATSAPPPAPPVAAGAADEAKPVRTVGIPPDAPSGPPARTARRAPSDRAQPRADDRVAALVLAAEQKRLNPAPVSQATALAPEPPKVASRPALAATRQDSSPPFQWPARGRVVARFGSDIGGAPNNGIDLAVPAGTDVLAAEDGVVLYTGNEIKALGNLILLRHRDDFVTAYAHAKSFQVKPGDTVRRGQVIAKSGQTGTIKAPQLHFEIRKDNAPVDPAQYLPPG